MTKFGGISVYLNCSDTKRSRAFYESLGLKRVSEMKEFDTVVYAAGPSSTLLVGPSTGGDPSATEWLKNKPWGVGVVITLDVDDVDVLFAKAKAAGAEVESEPADMPWGVRMMALVDPDGYSVWFQQMTRPARKSARKSPKKAAKKAAKKARKAPAKKTARRSRK